MLTIATNWTTISSLATGVGTLVLAIATFYSVRSANRSARIAEEALVEQRRPVLAQSRFDDPLQKIMFVERNWVTAGGGRGAAEHIDGRVYLVMSLRNVGAGIGVCQAWAVSTLQPSAVQQHLPESEYRPQTRDLYVPAGDLGMWQGALRDPDEAGYVDVANAIDALEPIMVELLYSDQVGEQRTITRFAVVPYTIQDTEEVNWTVTVVRHWFLDRQGPRSESDIRARAEQIMRRVEVAVGDEQSAAEVGDAASAEAGETDRAGANGVKPRQSDEAARSPVDGGEVDGGEPISVIPRPNCE
jgi:hypothetical protein